MYEYPIAPSPRPLYFELSQPMYEYPIAPSPIKIREKRVTCKSNGITSQWPTHSANDKILTQETVRNLPQNQNAMKINLKLFGTDSDLSGVQA